ncbi:hypothetical protein BJY04DRAFT_225188 [Aspergillus karnatakaensis]|uniref:uncharacterized protein n=1 Tax=Aspergillus karnatakaensis TaxID=1810916 RepID=UPI003CCC9FD4
MPGTDPFTYLNFDCACRVLSALDIQSLLLCERVSKGWQTLVWAWIAEWGLRAYFPGETEYSIDSASDLEPSIGVQRFKYLAERQHNLEQGRATSVQMFTKVSRFRIAGQYAVWYRHPEMRFQQLGVKADGSIYEPQVLPLVEERQVGELLVNDEGYLVFLGREKAHNNTNKDCTLHVVSLPNAREVYSIKHFSKIVSQSEGDSGPTRQLVAVGAQRIYVIANTVDGGCVLETLDLLTGQERHGTRLSDYIPPIPRYIRERSSSKRSSYAVLRGSPELFLSLVRAPGSDTITIVNGENGHHIQTITGDFGTTLHTGIFRDMEGYFRTAPTLHVRAGWREFALSWPGSSPDFTSSERPDIHNHIHVRNFALRSGGLFGEWRSAVFLLKCIHRRRWIAVDPFRDLVAHLGEGRVRPQIGVLVPATVDNFKEKEEGSVAAAAAKPSSDTGAEIYIPSQTEIITLPPAFDGEGRSQFKPKHPQYGSVGFAMRFLDGDRVLYHVKSEGEGFDMWHLFHFAPDLQLGRGTGKGRGHDQYRLH